MKIYRVGNSVRIDNLLYSVGFTVVDSSVSDKLLIYSHSGAFRRSVEWQTITDANDNTFGTVGEVMTYLAEVLNSAESAFDIVIDSPEALGTPDQNGLIHMTPFYTHRLKTNIETPYRLVCDGPFIFKGESSENCSLKRTVDDGQAFITCTDTVILRDLTIIAPKALDLDADGKTNPAIDWFGVNFGNSSEGCAEVGTIANYSNFIGFLMAFLNSPGLKFDGHFGTIAFDSCLFQNSSGTLLSFLAGLNIARRVRIQFTSFIATSTATAVNVDAASTIPNNNFILHFCNFSGGGTYLSGIDNQNAKARFTENVGIDNSAKVGQLYWINNATPTPITQGVFTKLLGTATAGEYVSSFEVSDNRLTYIGTVTTFFSVTALVSLTSGNNNQVRLRFAKNNTDRPQSQQQSTTSGAGRLENFGIEDYIRLSSGDFVEIWATNDTGSTAITAAELNFLAHEL